MKIMHCPLNGPRNIAEFIYGGEVVAEPDSARVSDEDWTDFLFLENNIAGVVQEWWMHGPSAYWFIAERDTRSGEIVKTYAAPGEL